ASRRRFLQAGMDKAGRIAELAGPPTGFPTAAGANRVGAPSKGPYQRKAAIVYTAGTLFETLWIESGLPGQAAQVRHPDQSGPGSAILALIPPSPVFPASGPKEDSSPPGLHDCRYSENELSFQVQML